MPLPPPPASPTGADAGSAEAFEDLFRRHRDRLWATALATLRDPEEAADALQDAMLSAYRASSRPEAAFRGEAAVTTWLHRIVVNACIDRVRRRRARPTVPLLTDGGAEPADPHDMPAESDTALTVRAALAALSVDQRAALVLVDLQGFSVAEAAELLDVPVGTVKSRCARGRVNLAELLAPLRGRESRPRGNRESPPSVGPTGRDEDGRELP